MGPSAQKTPAVRQFLKRQKYKKKSVFQGLPAPFIVQTSPAPVICFYICFMYRAPSPKLLPFYALVFVFSVLPFTCALAQAQEEDNEEQAPAAQKSKLLTGFFVGSYFANKYSAAAYNGYGFDLDGKQNSFANSLMHQKIKNEFGGGYGQADQVALALGVDPKQWEFNESDMPVNMRYTPAIMLGFNFRVRVDKTSAILLNVNGARLNVEGNFTISTLKPGTSSNPVLNNNVKTFPIKGQEQRLIFQLGYQKIFGQDEKTHVMAELGFNGTLAKYEKNWIHINDLTIDLTQYINQTQFPAPVPGRVPVGFGIGAFAGAGLNVPINPKFTLQMLYTLSHEKVNFGINPALKLQHALGLRIYYNL